MAYITPLEVWDQLGLVEEKSEDFSNVGNNSDMDLSNNDFLINNAFTSSQNSELSSDQTVIVTDGSGNVEDPSDYSVDKRDGVVTNDSMGSDDYTVRYKTAPLPNETVKNKISDIEKEIENKTNTVFDGEVTVTDELYDGLNDKTATYVLRGRPVQSLEKVEVNEAKPTDSDDWQSRTQGRGKDFIRDGNLGLTFVEADNAPVGDVAELRVKYKYGYSGVPNDIRRLALQMVIRDLMRENVNSANIEGKDNFDPDTTNILNTSINKVLNRYTVQRMGLTNLREKGSES